MCSQHCKKQLLACLSVHIEYLGSHWTDFREIGYLRFVQISAKKIKVSLESDKDSGYFLFKPMYIYDNITLKFFLG